MEIIEIKDSKYPQKLLKIKNPPERLYVEGNSKLLNNKALAIVGSRCCSEYGIKHAKEFAGEIASCGITIISGLAIGIDAIAHETAMNCKGNTIAVLGCGLNYMYPKENKELLKKILENDGCIISEYSPDKKPDTKNFPKRNRIISGISIGILVIEAGYRSGSTITGKYGFEHEKKVFCLPRDIGVKNGIGTNELIRRGATLVTTPKDILKEFKIQCYGQKEYIELNESIIETKYQDIYNLLSYVPQNIHYLAVKSQLSISEIYEKLTILELEGHIKALPGNNYIKME